MISICNILPNNLINKDMPRQAYELYLTHKILDDPDRFAFMANDKKNGRHIYKILDNSACELGKGLDFGLVLEAAKIIDADEVVLPDLIRSSDSLAYTLQYLKDLPIDEHLPNLAVAIQGETIEEILSCAAQVLSLRRIHTIMIPKWYCSMNSSNGLGRHFITAKIIAIMQHLGIRKDIHWLGCDTGIRELITPLSSVIRSVDSGYWTALCTDKWKDLDVTAERPRELKIDLHHMDVDMNRWQQLVLQQQKLIGEMQSCIK